MRSVQFETLPEHPASEKYKKLAPQPAPGEIFRKFKVGRCKCVSTLGLVVRKLQKLQFPKELKIIPHPKSIRVCWVVETI